MRNKTEDVRYQGRPRKRGRHGTQKSNMDDLPVREELDRRRENEMPNRSKTERGKKRKNKKRKCIGCAGVHQAGAADFHE
jgi:hypothetical protein